jgi:hypothetical protein
VGVWVGAKFVRCPTFTPKLFEGKEKINTNWKY